jgi:hypothetical protein
MLLAPLVKRVGDEGLDLGASEIMAHDKFAGEHITVATAM